MTSNNIKKTKSTQIVEDNTRDWLKELRDNNHIVKVHQNDDFITHSGLLYVVHRLFNQITIDTELVFIDRKERIAEYKATISVNDPVVVPQKGSDNNILKPAASVGTYTGHGDACPKTARGQVLSCYKRVAETRAVNRALRFIVGGVIGLCSFEEIDIYKEEESTRQPRTIKKQYKDHSLNDFKKWCDNYHGPDPMFEFCRMYSESKTYPDEWGSEKRLKFQESFDAGNFEEKYKKFWQNYALCLNDDHNYPADQIDTPF